MSSSLTDVTVCPWVWKLCNGLSHSSSCSVQCSERLCYLLSLPSPAFGFVAWPFKRLYYHVPLSLGCWSLNISPPLSIPFARATTKTSVLYLVVCFLPSWLLVPSALPLWLLECCPEVSFPKVSTAKHRKIYLQLYLQRRPLWIIIINNSKTLFILVA